MAKLTYTLDGIQFTDIKVPMHLSGGVVSKAKYTSGVTTASTVKGGVIDGNFQTFNAIDIDWNAANLGNYVNIDANGVTSNGNPALINTTYELIYQ